MNRASSSSQGNDGGGSYFQKAVVLGDWWLIKAHQEVEGKRFGVAGTNFAVSGGRRAVRVFTSAPIAKVFDVFTAETTDGICIVLRGFINKERTIQNGFSPEIFSQLLFGFPHAWDEVVGKCYRGETSADMFSTRMPDLDKLRTGAGGSLVSTPCKKDGIIEDKHDAESATTELDAPKVSSRSNYGHRFCSTLSPVEEANNDNEENCSKTDVKSNGLEKNVLQRKILRNGVRTRFSSRLLKSTDKSAEMSTSSSLGSTVKKNKSSVNEESSSEKRTRRRINFDVHASNDKQEKKENSAILSPESFSCKRSRSGRLLVSTLEFWRNQVPVYDADRNIIGIREELNNSCPSRGSRSEPAKKRKR